MPLQNEMQDVPDDEVRKLVDTNAPGLDNFPRS